MDMMQGIRRTLLSVMALAFAAALPTTAIAQVDESAVEVSVRAGPSMPLQELGDVTDVGTGFGADVALWLNDRVGLTIDGNVDLLRGDERYPELPDIQLYHYGLGLQARLVPAERDVSVMVMGGAGATKMTSSRYTPPVSYAPNQLDETYLSANAGAQVGYDVSDRVNVALRGNAFFVFADETDTDPLARIEPEVAAFDAVITVPLTLEVGIDLPNSM